MFWKLSNTNLVKLIWIFLILNLIILGYHFIEYYSDPYFHETKKITEGFKNLPTGLNQIPRILIINAENEPERLNKLKKRLQDYQVDLENTTRILYEPSKSIPLMRCAKAYLTAFRHAQARNYDYVLIMEDDFDFSSDFKPSQITFLINDFIRQVPKKDWDVVFLVQRGASTKPTDYPFLDKVIRSLTGGAFLVNKSYYTTLIQIAKRSLKGLKETSDKKYAIDEVWKSYQMKDNWFVFNPNLGTSGEQLCRLTEDDLSTPTAGIDSSEFGSKSSSLEEQGITPSPNTRPPGETAELLQKLQDQRFKSQNLYKLGVDEWDKYQAQKQKEAENSLKGKLSVPDRLDPKDADLKKVLEEIAKGSYKGDRNVMPAMKIPTKTLHPNPKCRKYYQLQMKS